MARIEPKNVKLIGFAGLTAIAVLGGVLVGQPLYAQFTTQNSAVEQAKVDQQTLQSQVAELQSAQTNIADLEELNNALLKKFPSLANIPNLLDSISNSALSAGISAGDITNVSFDVPTLVTAGGAATADPTTNPITGTENEAPATDAAAAEGSQLAILPVKLTVNGNSRQFQTFLSGLRSMERGFTVSTFGINLDDEGQGAMNLTGNTYLYKEITPPTNTATNGVTSVETQEVTPNN